MSTHQSDAAPPRRVARRGDDQAEAQVIALLEQLAPELDVEPDTAFRTATRQRLVAMAAVRTPEPVRPSPLRRLLAARASDAPASRWRTRATAGLAGAALTVTSLATLVALSTSARPGDALYGLKRGTEQTQLALAGDSRGQVLLDLARTRLDELNRLGDDAQLAESTLATMDSQTTEGASWLTARAVETGNAAQLDRLAGWTAEQSALLGAAQPDVPAAAADEASASQVLLSDVAARVEGLRIALECWSGPSTSGTDDLGPLPVPCPAQPVVPEAPGGQPAPIPPTAPGGPGAPAPSAPAGPTGQLPAPSPAPTSPSLPSAPVPAPSTPTTPGGLLPSLPPLIPTTPPRTQPDPIIDLPLPGGGGLCLDLPVLLRVGC